MGLYRVLHRVVVESSVASLVLGDPKPYPDPRKDLESRSPNLGPNY